MHDGPSEISAEGERGTWLIWQMLDSAFPTGGFAHSGGLEAAWQRGEISSADELADFLRSSIEQVASGALPFALGVCRSFQRFEELDAMHDAMLSNHAANRASRAQGRALLATSVQVFRNDALSELRERARGEKLPAHFAPVLGAVAAALRILPADLSQMFLFMHLRGLITAAVRLGIVGPLQAQNIQQEMAAFGSAMAALSLDVGPSEAAQTAPVMDLLQATHDRLYSKLFIS
jgi:urease accessory protein